MQDSTLKSGGNGASLTQCYTASISESYPIYKGKAPGSKQDSIMPNPEVELNGLYNVPKIVKKLRVSHFYCICFELLA